MTTTFLNGGENGGGEKEDAKMVREAMEEVVERATKKLNGKVPTFAMLFATPEAMRNLTTTTTKTTGKEEDEDEEQKKKKKKKKMAKSGGVSSSSSSSLPKLCRELLRKKIKGSEDVKLIGGVVESIISGHAQTQNGRVADAGELSVRGRVVRNVSLERGRFAQRALEGGHRRRRER